MSTASNRGSARWPYSAPRWFPRWVVLWATDDRLLVLSWMEFYIYVMPSYWHFLGRSWELKNVRPQDGRAGGFTLLSLRRADP